MGSKGRRLSGPTLQRVCFALSMIFACVVILVYIAKKRPELLRSPLDTSGVPIEPLQTPMLDELIGKITTVATDLSDAASEFLHRDSSAQKVAADLELRANSSLTWMASAKDNTFIRWDLVANADVHIVQKLLVFLRQAQSGAIPNFDLDTAVTQGLQCSPLQAAQQELISRFISMDICSEVEWYKLVQLAAPEMRTFVDVGANKGYLGSLFVALWGGGKLGVNPATILSLSKTLDTWPGSRNPGGYCRDGFNSAIQSYCPAAAQRDPVTGRCETQRDVKVYSFDGSSYLAQTLNTMMRDHIAKGSPAFSSPATSPWVYTNAAVANTVGTARFTKQNKTERAGYEGGSIQRGAGTSGLRKPRKGFAPAQTETEEVPMISIDHFVAQRNLSHIDILKIDTEGHDNNVLLGAREALQSRVSMFTFEGGKGVTLSRDMLREYDSWGFSCYSTSRAGLFKWSGNCMKDQYMGGFRAKDKGNIFCVNRKHAPAVALAFDALTFPAMIDSLLREAKVLTPALRGMQALLQTSTPAVPGSTEVLLPSKVDPAALVPLYIDIKPFCQPFPRCAAAAAAAQ